MPDRLALAAAATRGVDDGHYRVDFLAMFSYRRRHSWLAEEATRAASRAFHFIEERDDGQRSRATFARVTSRPARAHICALVTAACHAMTPLRCRMPLTWTPACWPTVAEAFGRGLFDDFDDQRAHNASRGGILDFAITGLITYQWLRVAAHCWPPSPTRREGRRQRNRLMMLIRVEYASTDALASRTAVLMRLSRARALYFFNLHGWHVIHITIGWRRATFSRLVSVDATTIVDS